MLAAARQMQARKRFHYVEAFTVITFAARQTGHHN